MNEAIQQGYALALGQGESQRYVSRNLLPYAQDCIFTEPAKEVYLLPIISPLERILFISIRRLTLLPWEQPAGRILLFCGTISELEGGVFLNVGSAVTGAEVFSRHYP